MNTASVRKRALLLLVIAGLALSQTGCLVAVAGAAAGAGAYAYYKGTVTDQFAVEFGEAYQASKEALADQAMPVISEHHQGVTGTIESSLEDGTKVSITVEEKPRLQAADGHLSEVGIRIGVFGDQNLSDKLMRQVSMRVAQRMRNGPILPPTGSGERLPALTPEPGAVHPPPAGPTVGTGGAPWKPAAGGSGEPPKPY
jgi:hypothetical protein